MCLEERFSEWVEGFWEKEKRIEEEQDGLGQNNKVPVCPLFILREFSFFFEIKSGTQLRASAHSSQRALKQKSRDCGNRRECVLGKTGCC